MTSRCDLTDLLVDQCAHCLAHLEQPTADVTITGRVTAQYHGRCALDARHPIEPGDLIGATDHGWICEHCAGGAR